MLIEYVEVNACNKCISDGILLVKESGICTGFNIIPCSPFIHHKTYLMILIIFVHDSGMAVDKFFHEQSLAERHVPFFLIKSGRSTLLCPIIRERIIMQRNAIHKSVCVIPGTGKLVALVKNSFCPLIVLRIRTAGDLIDLFIRIILLNI